MMKTNYFLVLCVLLFPIITLTAQQWDEALEELGVSVEDYTTLVDGTIQGQLQSLMGTSFSFILRPDLSSWEDDLQQILTPLETFEFIQIERLQFTFDKQRSEAFFLLSDIAYPPAVELTGNIPSGVYFYLNDDDELYYSLRMLVSDYVLRVVGQYFNEETFLRRLILARSNPVQFLRGQDPEFILDLLERIENRLISLEDSLQVVREEFYAEQGGIANLGDRIDQLDAITETLDSSLDATIAQLATSNAAIAATDEALKILRDGSVPLLSKGIGSPKAVDDMLVAAIVAAIRENPTMSNTEIRKKMRDEQAIKASVKLIYTVRSLYFGRPEAGIQ